MELRNFFKPVLVIGFLSAIQPAFSQTTSISIIPEDNSYQPEVAAVAALLSGSWINSGVGPTLTNKSTNYALTIPVLGPVPAGSVITSVNYSWNLSTVPSGLTVSLCHNTTATCVNVTSSKNGSVANFNGLDANKKFIYVFRVSGSGSIFPVAYGMSDQVIVNYN